MTHASSVRNILICRPQMSHEPISDLDAQVCPGTGNTRFKLAQTRAYISSANEAAIPVDYAQSGAFWTLAFGTVVGLWFVSAHVGAVLNFIRRG